jgi:hypothetical protein
MAAHSVAQPKPVLTRAGIITVISVLTALLTKVGLGQVASCLSGAEDPIAGLVLAIGPVYTAVLSQRHTTPVASPRDNDGTKLVPVGSSLSVSSTLSEALAEAEEIYPSA